MCAYIAADLLAMVDTARAKYWQCVRCPAIPALGPVCSSVLIAGSAVAPAAGSRSPSTPAAPTVNPGDATTATTRRGYEASLRMLQGGSCHALSFDAAADGSGTKFRLSGLCMPWQRKLRIKGV